MTNIRPDSRTQLKRRNDASRTSQILPAVADPGEYVSAAGAARKGRNHTGAEHHTLAAEHHEQAARQHRQASQNYDEKDYAAAARASLVAHDHTRQAAHHSTEPGKYHTEGAERHVKDGSK